MKYSQTRIKIVKKICKSYNETKYVPQYFREPFKLFGITLLKGSWKCFKLPVDPEALTKPTAEFSNREDTKYFLNSKLAETKIEYVTYP